MALAGGGMRRSVVVLLWLASMGATIPCARAQENWLQADFRREGERVGDACKGGFKAAPGCAIELFTDHPLHIAAGSMPPQNGFGVGAAFSESRNTKNWRLSWDVDAGGSVSGEWRAGGYMNLVHTPATTIHVVMPTAGESGAQPSPKTKKSSLAVHPYTVFNLYAQTISLNKLNYFGLGNDSTLAGASVFGMTETIVGANAIKPVYEWAAIRKLNLALLGEVNGRFVNIRGEHGQSVPSIETVYTNATAPGLSSQPGFVQMSEGLRIKPVIADYLQLNYMGNFQEYFAPSSSQNSFLRWTVDLNHTLYLYGYTQSAAKNTVGNGVPGGFSLTKSERLDQCEATAFRVDQFGDQRGAVLFSADAGRVRHQWCDVAGQLSGLPVSGSQSSVVAGVFRALDLGAVWVEVYGGREVIHGLSHVTLVSNLGTSHPA